MGVLGGSGIHNIPCRDNRVSHYSPCPTAGARSLHPPLYSVPRSTDQAAPTHRVREHVILGTVTNVYFGLDRAKVLYIEYWYSRVITGYVAWARTRPAVVLDGDLR